MRAQRIVPASCALLACLISPVFAADATDIKYCKSLALNVCQVVSTGFSPTSSTNGIADITYCRSKVLYQRYFLGQLSNNHKLFVTTQNGQSPVELNAKTACGIPELTPED